MLLIKLVQIKNFGRQSAQIKVLCIKALLTNKSSMKKVLARKEPYLIKSRQTDHSFNVKLMTVLDLSSKLIRVQKSGLAYI